MSLAKRALFACVAVTLMVTSCTKRETPAPASGSVSAADESAGQATDAWLGQWNGPEGTFLRIDGGKGRYEITVQNLDGPRTFQGTADGKRIRFERDGVTELVRATTGAETGMKWLAEKSNCLTVKPGEGYCRD